jgi:tetratricopeptide (TPR) repeat protein
MAKAESPIERAASTADAGATAKPHALPVRLIVGAARWATASKLRMAVGGGAGLAALAILLAVWSYIAHLAVNSLEPASLDAALAALDAGRFDDARALIGDLQEQVATPALIGGAMYILGAAKAQEADLETSHERQTAMHLLAAKYLEKAAGHGVPAGREPRAAYLLGKCLALGGLPEAAIPPLEDALRLHVEPASEIHAMLVRAQMDSPDPDLDAALDHIAHVIEDPAVSGPQRDEAWLLRAETLLRLEKRGEALAALEQVKTDGPSAGRRLMVLGRLQFEAAAPMPATAPQRSDKLKAALAQFGAAQQLDSESGPLAREATFWTARCYELLGDRAAALAEFNRLSNLYGDTEEGVAATMAEADHARLDGETSRALGAYRAVLQAIGNPHTYDNPLLPLAELRTRLWAAYQQFVGEERFSDALAMLEMIEPVAGRAECMEQRARTLQQWGARLRDQAEKEANKQAAVLRQEGRAHLRAAGRSYEDLSHMRYATRYFTRDLWAAADCYFQGQSFSNAARVLEEFLHHEARQWNSIALVRLGQARIARGEFDQAIAALEECIEVYPRDAGVYQARIEAALAHQQLGRADAAEQLLRQNLEAPALTPSSPEWRDSLFALGRLQCEQERYAEAVDTLDEAVRRYPADGAALMAKYMIARSYHNGALEIAAQLRAPRSATEIKIDQARASILQQLENAHAAYVDVQETITLAGNADGDPLMRTLLRNCYMMQGSVLMELKRFEEARQSFQNVISLYQNDPVVLESFVQVATCWRRLDQPAMARGNLERAKVVLAKMPQDADFLASTNFNRQQWTLLLDEMSKW